MKKIFIDGSVGTTGLRIRERLLERDDILLLALPEELRKDSAAKKEKLNEADIVFLCLPDEAAREALSLVENPDTVVLDTSTAHRTDPGWVYGFPEVVGKKAVRASKRIAVPGCHACGFIALIAPLVKNRFLSSSSILSCTSLTGYSGGGKKMIAEYESSSGNRFLDAPRVYGLTQNHKHLKEMKALCGLETPPSFLPIVSNFYSGMLVSISLHVSQVNGKMEDIKNLYKNLYAGPVVRFEEDFSIDGFLCSNRAAGKDGMTVGVYGNEERFTLTALYDNLGKGASGAAIQCMNILLGCEEIKGLVL